MPASLMKTFLPTPNPTPISPKPVTTIIPSFTVNLVSGSSLVSVYYGKKRYELSDWLGNVRVVISDKKIPNNTSGNIVLNYKPEVLSVRDYYAYGSEINERTFEPIKPKYRYGFNTQEKVFEINKDHYTARYWEYDSRLGRRWNVDPKPTVGFSEYAVNMDDPISKNDPEGDCPPGSPCAGFKAGLSFRVGTRQNRIGVTLSGYAGFGSTEANASISLFYNRSSFGPKGGSYEMQLTGGLTQGFGRQTNSNEPHDFSIGANNTGRAGSFSLYTTAYITSNGTNQRVAGIGFTAGNVKATFEDDFIPFVASRDRIGKPILGDAGDRYRTAALNFEVKVNNTMSITGGFKLFTDDPRLYGMSDDVPKGFSSAYKSVGLYSNGILYGGIRVLNYKMLVGWEAEKIRTKIQNGFHKLPLINSPYVPPIEKDPINKPFIEIGTNNGSSSY
jgi:hypothetical protein